MAVYNPHLFSHKLCRILDAGLISVDDLARLAELTPRFIERVAEGGLKPDRDTELRISKVIGPLFIRNPELYRDRSPVNKRGVEEVELRTRDWRGFEVTDSAGHCIMYVEWPKKAVTQARIDGLWRWLDKEDPQPVLQII